MWQDEYVCTFCRKRGVKLWREYQTMLSQQTLACADCALKQANTNPRLRYEGPVDANGQLNCVFVEHGFTQRTSNIGWRVPAIEDGEGNFWGMSSAPPDAVYAWQQLPLEPTR